MPLTAGTKLGPYEILGPLGAGGMGEVYHAKDTRLGREVAIKILPEHFSSDPVRKQRFDREAKVISGLNHPNICVLHDIGQQDSIDFLVMEYLEGETLAKRLEKGPLSADQVARSGREIAEALDRAHTAGVIHRDLKPANIILTKSGAKLLDFGLAKPAADLVGGITLTAALPPSPATQEGIIVGTFRYMSPEQLEGKELDGRSDIFSLGAVLYEALTGSRAFPGTSQLSVASAILEKEPAPILSLKPMTSPALDHAIRRCLMKDREDRWQVARDLAEELRWVAEAGSSGSAVSKEERGSRRAWLGWVLAALLGLGLILFATGVGRQAERPMQTLRVALLPPAGASFLPYNFAISPDGSRLAFAALGSEGKTALWVRSLSSANALQLTGTEGASYPFWSPEGQRVGFFAQGRLKIVELATSSVRNVCEAPQGFGGTWNREGVIVFAPGVTGPMYRVKESGGTPEAVTKVSGPTQSHHWPYFLPDGHHFLYYVNWSEPQSSQKNGIYAGSLDGRQDPDKLIAPEVTGNVQYAEGYLLYVQERAVMAQRFDTGKMETIGAAVPLTQPELEKFYDFWHSSFSVSQEGKLVFTSTADAPSRPVWYDKLGKEQAQFPETGYEGPQFSRDGKMLAVSADDQHDGKHFIRIYDLQRGVSSRLTDGGGESSPVWSPDGKLIAYRNSDLGLAVVPVDNSAPPRVLLSG